MANNNVVARAGSQLVSALPKFVIENYPKFVNFLRAYYTWSATEGPDLAMEAMKLANDVDLVIEEMLPSYRASYAKNFPIELKTDFRHFAKFLKEFYQLRGTEESYRIFFKAVFNEEASVYFPRIQLFKPSEAVWNKETFFKASATSGNPFDLINAEITGLNNGYKAIVSNVVKVGDLYDIYFEEANGEFEVGETIVHENISVTIVPIFKVSSFTSTQDWYDSSIIHTNGVVLKVDKIIYGRIVGLAITDGGTGYEVDDVITSTSQYFGTGFKAKVTSVDGSGAITSIAVQRSGFGFSHDDVDIIVESSSGTGAILEPVFDSEFRKIKSLSFIQNDKYTNGSDLTVTLPNGTQIVFTQGVTNTVKYWVKPQSTPSTGYAKLHDSDYYQEYSYEIQSKADVKAQEESLKALMHIAGLKMFVKTILQEEVTIDAETDILFS